MKTREASCLLCSIACILNACGSAASSEYELPEVDVAAPIAKMHAQLDQIPTMASPELLRVALVWLPVSPAAGKSLLSQDLSFTFRGLGGMDIDISRPPPESAVQPLDIMRYGQADLILYQDSDGDGQLDIKEGNTSLDLVLGRANGTRVWWSAGTPAPSDARGYKPIVAGWSYTYGPIKYELEPNDCTRDSDPGGRLYPHCPPKTKVQAVDVSQQDVIPISVQTDRSLQPYACRGFWGTSPEKSDQWPDTTRGWYSPAVRGRMCDLKTCDCTDSSCELDLPLPGRSLASPLSCNAERTMYVWKDCEPDPALCGTVFCHTGIGVRDTKKAAPANWPCPPPDAKPAAARN
jgi:hypothetical protein